MPRPPNRSKTTIQLLQQLLLKPAQWHYGYELSTSTGIKSGTLYPMLIRLHESGLLEADWQASAVTGAPPRHVYRLSAAGVTLARNLTSPSPQRSARQVVAPQR